MLLIGVFTLYLTKNTQFFKVAVYRAARHRSNIVLNRKRLVRLSALKTVLGYFYSTPSSFFKYCNVQYLNLGFSGIEGFLHDELHLFYNLEQIL